MPKLWTIVGFCRECQDSAFMADEVVQLYSSYHAAELAREELIEERIASMKMHYADWHEDNAILIRAYWVRVVPCHVVEGE
jgi:hypothetical protein